jgi:hypothetical protein
MPSDLEETLETIRSAGNPDLLGAALRSIEDQSGPSVRAAIVQRFTQLQADGPKKDQGAVKRTLLIQALRGRSRTDDIPMLEAAMTTYEFMPPRHDEVAAGLRGAALVTMADLDESRAAFHAVRLLSDEHTAEMSGEPAVTAARVLATQGQVLPLYQYLVTQRGGFPEVVAECLRTMVAVPASILMRLIERAGDTTNEVALLGVFDLILEHPDRAAFAAFIEEFIETTKQIDVFRYVVAAIVARRDPTLIEVLRKQVETGTSREKEGILQESLALLAPPGASSGPARRRSR